MKVTLTLEDGTVLHGDVTRLDSKADVQPVSTGSVSVPLGGTAVTLPAVFTAVAMEVPAARELVVSIADGAGNFTVTVKGPDGAVCQLTPAIIPGGSVPRGPAESVPIANAGYVAVVVYQPGTYTAEILCGNYTGRETVEARVN